MKVKFDYERIHKKVDFFEFRNELRAFCAFMLTNTYIGPILENSDRLYKDKAFVALLHKWAEYNERAENEPGGYCKDMYVSDRDSLSWIIAEML